MGPFERLFLAALAEVAGPDANRVLWERRAALTEAHGRSVGYEIVLPVAPPLSWDQFVERTLGRLFEHLIAKREPVPGGPHVLTPVWRGDTMFVFDAPTLFRAIAKIEDVTEAELRTRAIAWQRALHRPDAEGRTPLQLPPPKPES